jgi:probable F420-dependent oxidoreductase
VTLRIGLNLSTSAAPGSDPARDARHAEELGFDFVSVSDHLHGTHATYETWTYLTWAAAATTRIDVVSNVLGLPYRSPAVLAKMAESLDRLSGGRLVLGLGAGGMDTEFEAFGLGTRTPGEKVAALDDALTILHGLWSEPSFSHDGPQYSVHGAVIEPKPPRPIPIWIGAYGERALRLIGRRADGWLPSMPFVPPGDMPAKRATVRAAAEAAGRDPDTLTYAYNVSVAVGHDVGDDRVVSGSAEQVTERLGALVADLGLTAINVWPAGESADQAEAFAGDVLAHLR